MKSAGEELRVETVDPGTLDLVKRLMADKRLDEFNLVGGTALALQLGHRKSIDVDLFTVKEFDSGRLAEHLKRQYNAEIFLQNEKGVFGFIEQVKVDMMRDPHSLIDKPENIEGVRMLSLREIGAMKMYSVHDDGGRMKDFADIHKLLERNPLNIYLDYARKKYPEIIPLKLKQLLVDQPNADLDDKVHYIGKPVEWHEMANRLREAYRNPGQVFGEAHQLINEKRSQKAPRQRRGHRPE
jgi:hypothetical protein